jgi:ADP-heptose:LPS heptosyltransferase
MKRILVIRLNAIGDVAMTVPVIWSLSKAYPDTEITFVSQKFATGFIKYIPRVKMFEADLKGRHKGFWGLIRLFFDLKKLGRFDLIADLHDVLRTKFIRFLFTITLSKVKVIDKGRAEKHNLTKNDGKVFKQLPTTVSRYADVFYKAGLKFNVEFDYLFTKSPLSDKIISITGQRDNHWIGVAPFAKHKGKVYPLESMEKVMALLSQKPGIKIFLFGGGAAEKEILERWEKRFTNTVSLAGKLSIEDELKVISNLEVLLSMDSANMHFASLVNTTAVTVWGATHPFAGFYGWKQNPAHALQINFPCRPCSIYGNRACFRKDYACLNLILPEDIVGKIFDEIIV